MKKSIRRMFHPAGEKDSGAYDGIILHSDSSTSIQEDPQLIFKLIQEGNMCRIQNFIMKYPSSLMARDDLDFTPLHYATKHGQLELMLMIINETSDEALDAVDTKGNTPLHLAVQKNQLDSVKLLLTRGANPNKLNHYRLSPLHQAIQLHYNSIVETLLDNSTTDLNLEGDLGNTPIMQACYKDNAEALLMLFDRDVKLCKRNKIGCYPIHMTAFAGSLKCMDLVLKKGEALGFSMEDHINFTDNEKSSPLHVAVQNGRLEVVKACIGYGARVDFKQIDNATPLHFAATQGATEIVRFMVSSYKGDQKIVDLPDGNNETPLHKSCLFDHVELAEYLISMGANIDSVDKELRTPLLLATSCSSWKVVNLLLEKGADIKLTDNYGRNFLHLTVLQPGGLKNIRQEILQREDIKHIVVDEDADGCTPLHYACRHGVPNSVNNLLGLNMSLYSKSKNKRSALHFAAFYGRYNTCERLLRFVPDSTLLNDADAKGMTPLHLAAQNGHDRIVFLLLRKGALLLSDYRGWTALHYAAFGGYTRTIKVLLDTSIALIDKPDKDKNTALHLAGSEGHSKAVGLLLDSGAAITLNALDASFLHEAIRAQRKDVVLTTIHSKRWEDTLVAFSENGNYTCPILEMVNHLPEGFKTLLDRCMVESQGDKKNWDYFIEYNFRYLQCPDSFRKDKCFKGERYYEPLITLNAMVQHSRVELLSHPVCKEFLLMKWRAYGFKAHLLNLAVYSLGLIPLTLLIVKGVTPSSTNSTAGPKDLYLEDTYFARTCLSIVMIMNIFGLLKELVQMYQQKLKYLMDGSNIIDWSIYVTSILFASAVCTNPLFVASWRWQCAAIAVFTSWVNFLIYLQRFETCGIYIVMFWEILRTLLQIIAIFFFLILGFALSFYVILTPQIAFKNPALSLMQTFTMMLGDVNYHDSFLEPLLHDELEYPILTFLHLITFTLLIPILLMNLLIGLAVGDIAEVQRNAALKRIAMQVTLHTNLEKKLPYCFLKRVNQITTIVYPNRPRVWGVAMESSMFRFFLACDDFKVELPDNEATMEVELWKQKNRLKELSTAMQKQHELIKLIIQKMEIVSEADDEDEQDFCQPMKQKMERKESKWDCVVKAVKSKS
ncbi:transient receptor potential cation channel subfamily A member 1 isoform X2 [Eleutherodactylus coqui]|uniref:transient receptor potential cation channel subfamily A member 1 isoform X2 n=1 Tax=Eleutherodactylus coqui TaxID=57060 RepID=UPI00346280B6